MRDEGEMARIRQREFYLRMAERFTKMADEYSPARHAENPLPIHGRTVVIVAHASSAKTMHRELDAISGGYMEVFDDGGRVLPMHHTGGRYSLFMEPIYPEQTEESYDIELRSWFSERSGTR